MLDADQSNDRLRSLRGLLNSIHGKAKQAVADLESEYADEEFAFQRLGRLRACYGALDDLDDDQFVPDDSVSVVAIIGELAGPRIAVAPLEPSPLRPMGQVIFADSVLDEFATGAAAQVSASANELVVFPQFGQLHAGPDAAQVAHLSPTRQLLVLRGRVDLSA